MLNEVLPFLGESTKLKKQEEAKKADAKKLAETTQVEAKKQAEATQVEAKKASSVFGNLSTQRANVDEVELTSSKKAEETEANKENKKTIISWVRKVVSKWEKDVDAQRPSIKENKKKYKNDLKTFIAVGDKILAEDRDFLSEQIGENFEQLEYLAQNIEEQPERLQRAVINLLSDKKYKDQISKKTLKHLYSVIKSDKTSANVKAEVIHTILNSENYTREQKDELIKKLGLQEYQDKIEYAMQMSSGVSNNAAICRMSDISCNNIGEKNSETLMDCISGCSHHKDKKTETNNNECVAKSKLYQTSTNAQAVYVESLKKCNYAESQVHALKCVRESEHTKEKTVTTAINEIKNFKKEAQVPSVEIISSSDRTTTKQRQLLAQQIVYFDEKVQFEASRVFMKEEKNFNNAKVMEVFAKEIANLKIPAEEKNNLLTTLENIQTVSEKIIEEVKTQIQTEIHTANYINNQTETKVSLVKLIQTFGQNVVNSRNLSSERPTLNQFIDMLNNEVFTAEFVTEKGYKYALIFHFSLLNGDTQEKVLKSLTREDKIMMRKTGRLPRRFWDNVDDLIAAKAVESQNISDSDAQLLAKVASNSVLHKCLTGSSKKMSIDSKNLFRQVLIDNQFLEKDKNGQYKLA